jgi:hypothetical protein
MFRINSYEYIHDFSSKHLMKATQTNNAANPGSIFVNLMHACIVDR